jgi:hypothetical protein
MISTRNCTSIAAIFLFSLGKSYSLLVVAFPSQTSLSCCSMGYRGGLVPASATKLYASDQKNNADDDSDQKADSKSLQESIDFFLDRPFFDPDKVLDNQTKEIRERPERSINPLVWFANLVKNDYQTAEALYAAGFISIMVVIAQELLRIVKYGDAYHPFLNVSSGSLF